MKKCICDGVIKEYQERRNILINRLEKGELSWWQIPSAQKSSGNALNAEGRVLYWAIV